MKIVSLVLLTLLLSSCASSPHLPAMLYTSSKGNVTTTLARGTVAKTGEACTVNYVGLVTLGDASIDTARKNAGIKKRYLITQDNLFPNKQLVTSSYRSVLECANFLREDKNN